MVSGKVFPVMSIVIVNYNGLRHLRKCIPSILKSNYPFYEIIIVDNGSSDGSVEFIRKEFEKQLSQIVILPQHNNSGFAVGNNIGASKARGKYILMLNSDTEVDPNCLGELVSAMERDESIGAAQAKILFMSQRDTFDTAGGFLNVIGFSTACGYKKKDIGQYDYVFNISYAKGAAMIVRKSVWTNIGGLESLFSYYFEDTDFCWRVWLSGYRVVIIPSAKVFHIGGGTTLKFGLNIDFRKNIEFQDNRNRIIMVVKNLELTNLALYIPWLLAMYAYYILHYFRRHDSTAVLGVLRGIFWCLRFFKVVWSRRLVAQSMRVVSDQQLFKKGVISRAIMFSHSFQLEP